MSRALRVFLDSNVLISALVGDANAAPVILVDWLAKGRLGPMITSSENIIEVERTLDRKLPAALPAWQEFVRRSGVLVVSGTRTKARGINQKDAGIVAAALRAEATHFVTGDKRLLVELDAATKEKIMPVTPRQMLELLLQGSD